MTAPEWDTGDGPKRRDKYVTIFSDWGLPTENLADVIKWLGKKLAEIPAEHRDSAMLDFTSDSEGSRNAEIYYYRKETDEEVAERVRTTQASAARSAAHERAVFEALKAKYEPS